MLTQLVPIGRNTYKAQSRDYNCVDGRIIRGYKLTGPRGGTFYLYEAKLSPGFFFATSKSHREVKLGGFGWFTDQDGTLKPVGR